MAKFSFPNGKKFAFAIIDDTDVATLDNVKPVYDFLYEINMKATKTVWPVACPEGSKNFSSSHTLEDRAYLEFVKDIKDKGFEISWHSPTMESSKRERIEIAFEKYNKEFGEYPRIHVNHALNRESIYWGDARIDISILKFVYRTLSYSNHDYYLGHVEGSPYWWGDLCKKYIKYARNLTFNDINTAKYNPSMPYFDKKRPLVPWWFSSSDADNVVNFVELIHPDNQRRLEKQGGFCIVATHFGKGFFAGGKLDDDFKTRMEMLSKRNGWFPNAGELLDWLANQRKSQALPHLEWMRMQMIWAKDMLIRKYDERRKRKQRKSAGV